MNDLCEFLTIIFAGIVGLLAVILAFLYKEELIKFEDHIVAWWNSLKFRFAVKIISRTEISSAIPERDKKALLLDYLQENQMIVVSRPQVEVKGDK